MSSNSAPLRLVVLISGRGSNLQAILDSIKAGRLAARVVRVVSDDPAAGGLTRARAAGVDTAAVDRRAYPDRGAFERALQDVIEIARPDLVVLAGFMRIMSNALVARYAGRMLNIHPSLLPAYRGLDTHARVLADGTTRHGATVHFVTAELDGGPVVLHKAVAVLAGDTAATLAARVLAVEHEIYSTAIGWFAAGRLRLAGPVVHLDGRPIPVTYA